METHPRVDDLPVNKMAGLRRVWLPRVIRYNKHCSNPLDQSSWTLTIIVWHLPFDGESPSCRDLSRSITAGLVVKQILLIFIYCGSLPYMIELYLFAGMDGFFTTSSSMLDASNPRSLLLAHQATHRFPKSGEVEKHHTPWRTSRQGYPYLVILCYCNPCPMWYKSMVYHCKRARHRDIYTALKLLSGIWSTQ